MIARLAAYALGAVFLVSGASKAADLRRWNTQSSTLGVPWPVAAPVPFLEVAVAALLFARLAQPVVASVAVAMLVAFTVFLVVRIRQGRRPPCACFGGMSSKPIGWGHVARNSAFIALGIVAALA